MAYKGSAKARRSSARLAAVQVLYQMRLNKEDASSALSSFTSSSLAGVDMDGETLVPPDAETLDAIVRGVEQRWSDVDGIIAQSLAHGGKKEVEILLDCILRAGTYELIARGDIDTGIIINDYLNVTSSFYAGSETKLVNAILDRVAKAVRE